MQRPLKILALTAAVTAALVSASVQAETYLCESFWGTQIFKRSDDGKAFHRPASKDKFGEKPKVEYTTIRETDEDIWLYFVDRLEPSANDGCESDVCGTERDIMHLSHISKRYLSYLEWGIQGRPVGTKHVMMMGDKYTNCTEIP